MKTIKKYEVVLKVLLVFRIIFGLLCCFAIGITVPYLINKNNPIEDWFFIFLMIIITIVAFSIYFLLLVYPNIVKKKNKLSRFADRHSISIGMLALFTVITLVAVNNQKEYNEQRISELLNIEWVIFGITVAFFTIWNALYLSKEKKVAKNPNTLVGMERIIEINSINSEVNDNKSMIYSVVLLILNTIFLLFTTAMFYISSTNEGLIRVLSTISFYLCTNAMFSLFVETIMPMLINKLEYDSTIEKYVLDDGPEVISQAIIEEVVLQFAKNDFKDLTDEEKKKKLNELTKKINDSRENADKNNETKGKNESEQKE